MAAWFKKHIKLKKVTNLLKDQVSLGLASLSNTGTFSQIELAIHRAINHDERVPDEGAVRAVLDVGRSSRMHVAYCVRIVMDRLNRTRSCIVALKCLIVIHRCIFEGGFMLQDQLSVRPIRGGRNYLNMSMFRDPSSVLTLDVSYFIRRYASFIEQWIITSRVLGHFLESKAEDQELVAERFKSMTNEELVKEILSLHDLQHDVCEWEVVHLAMQHPLVKEALRLSTLVTSKAHQELKSRFKEIQARSEALCPSEASALIKVCEQLSRDSTTHIYFFQVGLSEDDSQTVAGEVGFDDYELLNLKEKLQIASSSSSSNQSISADSGRLNVSDAIYPQMVTQSMRYERSIGPNSGARRRGGSMSDFSNYEKFL